jgi:MFS superfamily sulfate permease-like transporter
LIRARCSVLGNIPGTNIFESVFTCREAQEFRNIKIIRYEESVFYINVDNFKYQVMKLSEINPEERSQKIERLCKNQYKKLENLALEQKKCMKKNLPTRNLNVGDYVLDQVNIKKHLLTRKFNLILIIFRMDYLI